jgi:miniconductance mechanosensitive channel
MFDFLHGVHPWLPPVVGVMGIIALAVVADVIVRRLLRGLSRIAIHTTESNWDDALVERKVFRWLAQIVPGVIIFFGIGLVPSISGTAAGIIAKNVTAAYIVLMCTLAGAAFLRAANQIYEGYEIASDRPIKGFIQLGQVGIYIFGAIIVVSTIIDKSPVVLLSGVGAMTAVLLLIFKDTILSLVASIQLTGQDMINVGDWLEMPQFNADGDVIDIALHTVTVQNFDKTITRIPTHALISSAFKNWRGMSESGGRRIKRAIYIDLTSVRFLSGEEIEHFKHFDRLRDYIDEKQKALVEYNAAIEQNSPVSVNSRNLTNVGTFRAYVINYLRHHPSIHDEMALIVRQLPPGPEGLPIEIYAFSNHTNWVAYESVQSDIFDHLLAIVPKFELRVFQQPSGSDFRVWGSQESGAGTTAAGRP